MKRLITNYSFSAALKQVTFRDYISIDSGRVLLITNVSAPNVIIYNFAIPALGGTVSGNVLTLLYSTGSMHDSDVLQIYYDDPAEVPGAEGEAGRKVARASDAESRDVLQEILDELRAIKELIQEA